MLELIYDEELGYKRVIYRPKQEAVECANLCQNGDCLYMKLYAKANGGRHIGTQIDPLYCHKASVDELIEHFK